MISRVVIHPRHDHAKPFQEAFAAGLDAHGVRLMYAGHPTPCDLAVVWSHHEHAVINAQRAAGRPYLVMEAAYMADRLRWCSLGFNGLNGRATFPAPEDGGKRWASNFADLMHPWKTGGDYIMISGQLPGDEAIKRVDIDAWYRLTAAILAEHGMPVRFRPHPKAVDRNQVLDVEGAPRLHGSLQEALAGAAWVVTYNSNSAVDAVLAGVPAVACDQGSMAWDVAGHDPSKVPPRPDRLAWAHRMAFTQWLPEEMASGEAWEALKSCL